MTIGTAVAFALVGVIGVAFYIALAYLPAIVAGLAKGIVFKVRRKS